MFELDTSYRVRVRLKAKISPESRPRQGCTRSGGDEKTARGRFWGRFAAFWRVLGVFFAPRDEKPKTPSPGN